MIENRISNSLANGFLVNQLKSAMHILCVCGQNILLAAQQKVHKETFKKGSDSD
jgi:hypothetical protein